MTETPKFEFRQPISVRPRAKRHGDVSFVIDRALVSKFREEALVINLISRRYLFGRLYSALQPKYFRDMPQGSGVFIKPLAQTKDIIPGAIRPGDIDLLVIPYEGTQLILERTLAIEVKAIRAGFDKQGRSPNDFGYSQASSLLELGFPYVAIAHLVISDQSPCTAWRKIKSAKILDEEDRVGPLEDVWVDMLPADLIDRGYGRLQKNCLLPEIGLVCSYIGEYNEIAPGAKQNGRLWYPQGQAAQFSTGAAISTLQAIAAYFEKHARGFLETPRYDPPK